MRQLPDESPEDTDIDPDDLIVGKVDGKKMPPG